MVFDLSPTGDESAGGLALAGLLVLACAGGLGCGPESAESAQRFLIYDRNPESGEYVVSEEPIESLRDISTVEGDYANIRGGGSIRVTLSEPGSRSEESVRNSMRIEKDQVPTPDYEVRSDGLLVPWDFHSAIMFTLYHHIEQAHDYFVDRGVDPKRLGQVPVYYNVRQQFLVPVDLMTDNAAYAFTLDAFIIPPTLLIEDVPLAANRGVVVHEYSHLIFNRLVHGDDRAPEYLVDPWSSTATNHLRSINEGVADIFAALETEAPNFIDASLSEDRFNIDRDVSQERHYTSELQQTVEGSTFQNYNPYQLGSVIASTVWTQTEQIDNDRLAEAILETLRDLSNVGETNFRTRTFFDRLVENLPEQQREDACRTFRLRLDAIRNQLTCAD